MVAHTLLTEEFCDEFRTMLNKRFMLTPNEMFKVFMDKTTEHKVAKTEVVHASIFLARGESWALDVIGCSSRREWFENSSCGRRLVAVAERLCHRAFVQRRTHTHTHTS